MASHATPRGTTSPTQAAAPLAWLQLPMHASAHWQQCLSDLRRAQSQAVEDAGRDVGTLAAEARETARPLDLLGLQTAFVLEQCARASQLSTQALASVLDAQSRCVRDAEALLQDLLRQTFGAAGALGAGTASGAVAKLSDPSPASWLAAAQVAWSEALRCWLGALEHDVDAEPRADDNRRRPKAAA